MSRSPFRVAIARGFDVSARNSRGMLICSTSASVNMRSRNRPISPDVHPPSTHPFGKSRNSIYHDRLFSIFFPRHHTRQRARVIDSREVGSEKARAARSANMTGVLGFFSLPDRSLAFFPVVERDDSLSRASGDYLRVDVYCDRATGYCARFFLSVSLSLSVRACAFFEQIVSAVTLAGIEVY